MPAVKSPNLRVVKSDTDTTPQGAMFTGEYVNWGGVQKKVFVEKKEIRETKEIRDARGDVIYKRGPGGIVLDTTMKITETVGYEEREFIVDDLGNGQAVKVYKFREDPATIAEREKEARRKKFMDELFEKAEAAGGLDALLDADDEPKAKKTKPKDAA